MDSAIIKPLDLLTDRGDRKPSFIGKIYSPIAAATIGFVTAVIINFAYRRPVFSGIQSHIGFSSVGGFLGYYFDRMRDQHLARRDAVLRHYVELHPDDFPPIERKKYGEILENWVPIR